MQKKDKRNYYTYQWSRYCFVAWPDNDNLCVVRWIKLLIANLTWLDANILEYSLHKKLWIDLDNFTWTYHFFEVPKDSLEHTIVEYESDEVLPYYKTAVWKNLVAYDNNEDKDLTSLYLRDVLNLSWVDDIVVSYNLDYVQSLLNSWEYGALYQVNDWKHVVVLDRFDWKNVYINDKWKIEKKPLILWKDYDILELEQEDWEKVYIRMTSLIMILFHKDSLKKIHNHFITNF